MTQHNFLINFRYKDLNFSTLFAVNFQIFVKTGMPSLIFINGKRFLLDL